MNAERAKKYIDNNGNGKNKVSQQNTQQSNNASINEETTQNIANENDYLNEMMK